MYAKYRSLLSDTQSYQLDSGLDVSSRIDGVYDDEIYWRAGMQTSSLFDMDVIGSDGFTMRRHRHSRREQRRLEQSRMSTNGCDEFSVYHRHDGDISLDSAVYTHYDSMVQQRKCFRHFLPQIPGTTLHSTHHHSAGSQSQENTHLPRVCHLRSDVCHIKSNGTHCEGDKMQRESEGDQMRHDMETSQQVVADGDGTVSNEGHLVSAEGRSRSHDTRCSNCGRECSSLRNKTTTDHNMTAITADTVVAEMGQLQAAAVAKCNGQNAVSQGRVGTLEARCGDNHWPSDVLAVESYSGLVSRQLCQHLVRLMSELNTARQLNCDLQERLTSTEFELDSVNCQLQRQLAAATASSLSDAQQQHQQQQQDVTSSDDDAFTAVQLACLQRKLLLTEQERDFCLTKLVTVQDELHRLRLRVSQMPKDGHFSTTPDDVTHCCHDNEPVARQQLLGDSVAERSVTASEQRLQQLMSDNDRLSRDLEATRTSLNAADDKSRRLQRLVNVLRHKLMTLAAQQDVEP